MSRYSLRIKTAQLDFVPVDNFKNKYPPLDKKIQLLEKYTVSINDVATEEQFEKFCDDFDISSDNYVNTISTNSANSFSKYITIGTEDGKRINYGHILRSDIANKYFGINDRYIKLIPIKYLSANLKTILGYAVGATRKPHFRVSYTGDNEGLKKIFDQARGKLPGLTNLQWYELLEKPRLIKKWVEAGNNPDEFKNPKPNEYFSNSIFQAQNLNNKLRTRGFSKEQISSMSMQDKINELQSIINRQLEEFFIYGKLLPSTSNEEIKYIGHNYENLPDEVIRFGATIDQWSNLISKKWGKNKNLRQKFREEEFLTLSPDDKSQVISRMWDNGEIPSKTKPEFEYTGNDPKTIEKLKEYGLYGRPISSDDIRTTEYISYDNFRQRLKRQHWKELYSRFQQAIISNSPNAAALRDKLQQIWNVVLTYSSNKSQMDKILDDTLKPLNKLFEEQGITFQDEQIVHARYQAGKTSKNIQLRFDYLIRKNGKIVLAIENQGDQHYVPNMNFDKETPENNLQKWLAEKLRDKIKLDYCHDHNIPLLYISGYLTTVEYKKIAENLAKNINYYVNLIPEEQQLEQPGENRQNQYIVRESNDLETELQKYADRLVASHFSELQQPIYADLDPSRIQSMIHDKKILLSNLLGVFASNFKVNGYNNLDYIKSLNEATDLSQYYRYIDAACARFGYADSQLGRTIEQIALKDRIAKSKYKFPDFSSLPPQPIKQETKPVQEMSLKRHKKKKYKIRRLF